MMNYSNSIEKGETKGKKKNILFEFRPWIMKPKIIQEVVRLRLNDNMLLQKDNVK